MNEDSLTKKLAKSQIDLVLGLVAASAVRGLFSPDTTGRF